MISLVVFLFVFVLLLNKVVVKPVFRPTKHIKVIRDTGEVQGKYRGNTGDLSKRIQSKRAEEIGNLTRQYNKMHKMLGEFNVNRMNWRNWLLQTV